MRLRPVLVAGLAALTGAVAAAPAAAHNHVPPRESLEIGDVKESKRFLTQGFWWGSGRDVGCGPIAIDAAPELPRAVKVPSGRYRLRVIYRTPVRPKRVRAAVSDPGGTIRNRRVRLRPRRQGGEVVAWAARLRGRIHRRKLVYARGIWRDENGCGREEVESLYPLRGVGPRQPGHCRCRAARTG